MCKGAKNVVQLVQGSDGSIAVIVGRTGVNVGPGQTVVWSGLTDAAANQAQLVVREMQLVVQTIKSCCRGRGS